MMLQLIDLETVGTLAHWKGCLWWGIDIMDVLSNCSMDGPIKSPEVPAYCIVGWKKNLVLAKCYSKCVPKRGWKGKIQPRLVKTLVSLGSIQWQCGLNQRVGHQDDELKIYHMYPHVESVSGLTCGISSTQGDPRGHRWAGLKVTTQI